MSSRSGKRRGRPPKTAVSDRNSLSSRFQYQLKKPKYLQNSDSQFSTPSASRASSPQNSDDGLSSRRTSGRSSTRRPKQPPAATASHSKRGGHSAPTNTGRRGEARRYYSNGCRILTNVYFQHMNRNTTMDLISGTRPMIRSKTTIPSWRRRQSLRAWIPWRMTTTATSR